MSMRETSFSVGVKCDGAAPDGVSLFSIAPPLKTDCSIAPAWPSPAGSGNALRRDCPGDITFSGLKGDRSLGQALLRLKKDVTAVRGPANRAEINLI